MRLIMFKHISEECAETT